MIVPIECRHPPADEVDDSAKQVHLLTGCSIEYNGPANVETYFKSSEPSDDTDGEKKGSSFKTAYFRGRLMKGVDVPLPPGYTMYVCNKEDETGSASEDGVPKCRMTAVEAEKITLWKHHVSPDMETDSFVRSLDWPLLASALHES